MCPNVETLLQVLIEMEKKQNNRGAGSQISKRCKNRAEFSPFGPPTAIIGTPLLHADAFTPNRVIIPAARAGVPWIFCFCRAQHHTRPCMNPSAETGISRQCTVLLVFGMLFFFLVFICRLAMALCTRQVTYLLPCFNGAQKSLLFPV